MTRRFRNILLSGLLLSTAVGFVLTERGQLPPQNPPLPSPAVVPLPKQIGNGDATEPSGGNTLHPQLQDAATPMRQAFPETIGTTPGPMISGKPSAKTDSAVRKPVLPPRPPYLDAPLSSGLSAENGTSPGERSPLSLDLGPGVAIPAAILDDGSGLTPQEAAAKQHIVDTFHKELSDSLPEDTAATTTEENNGQSAETAPNEADPSDDDDQAAARAYARALERADAMYKALFGEAAYNAAAMKAAIQAMPASEAGAAPEHAGNE